MADEDPTPAELEALVKRCATMHKLAARLCRVMIEETLEMELHPKMGILALYHFMRLQVRYNLQHGNFDIEDIKMSKAAFDLIAERHTSLHYEVSPEDGIVEIQKH